MRVIKKLDSIPFPDKKLVVALGNFDGVHLGHQHLLSEMVKFSRQTKTIPAVFLFHPHPQKILDPARAPKMLIDLNKKIELLELLGIKVVFIIPFNHDFAILSPEQFIKEILIKKLKVLRIYVGFNYRFGRAGQGTPEMLSHYGKKFNFSVTVIPPITVEGTLVSSTTIRAALEAGDITQAEQLLGYWPLLKGVIVQGNQRGRSLGFPTANIDLPPDLIIPGDGVYAGQAYLEGKHYPAVLNIGYCPTFDELNVKTIEAHLINYRGFAYGKAIEVELYQRLRAEQKFNKVQDLVQQIKKDIQETAIICKKHGSSCTFLSKRQV
ncbi:MAG: bifunctional riboflavin kinase/FAD synthetase [Bacillota bacterium]|nr:bifunctional riboflavin kinase/FAD synthetase [Bacillota bacterium]